MITAYGDAETKRKALEGGAEALLTKPIDFGALRSEIDTRVARVALTFYAADLLAGMSALGPKRTSALGMRHEQIVLPLRRLLGFR